MEEQLLKLLSFDKKIYGKELARKLDISAEHVRKLIAKVRRNWNEKDYFLIGDREGYWLSRDKVELQKYYTKTLSRLDGTMKELKNLERVCKC